jgi:hypothetical protein
VSTTGDDWKYVVFDPSKIEFVSVRGEIEYRHFRIIGVGFEGEEHQNRRILRKEQEKCIFIL